MENQMILGSPDANYMATIENFPAGARKVVTGRRDIPTALYITRIGQQVPCEHLLEADAVTLFDFDLRTQSIRAQPHQLRFVWGGRRIKYTPDFLVVVDGTEFIIEVKSHKWLERDQRTQEKLFRVKLVYELLGLNFRLITDQTIRVEPRLSNIKEILRYRNYQVPSSTESLILSHLQKVEQDTISNLSRISTDPTSSPEIRALIAQGKLSLDMGQAIGERSTVTLQNGICFGALS